MKVKISELTKYILHYGIMHLEEHPDLPMNYEVITGLETIERIITRLAEDSEDERANVGDVEKDHTEWIDLLDENNVAGSSAIDCLIESLEDGGFFL